MAIPFDKYEKQGDYHWKCWRDKQSQYSQHAAFVSKWITERPVLDVGCGDGLITHLLGAGAKGIDNSEKAIRLSLDHGLNVRLADVYLLDEVPEFWAAYMGDIVEHLDDPGRAIDRVRSSLFSGGMLYISTPPKKKSGQLQSPYHLREYSPLELVELVEKRGFELIGEVKVRHDLVQMYAKFKMV